MADPTRLQLLSLVMACDSACICDLTDPVGLLWSSLSTPSIGTPFVELSTRLGGAEVESVLLPLRPPLQPGRLVDGTWDGRRLDPAESWAGELGWGARIWRSFDSFDVGLWWMDARDRRPWIDALDPDEPEDLA